MSCPPFSQSVKQAPWGRLQDSQSAEGQSLQSAASSTRTRTMREPLLVKAPISARSAGISLWREVICGSFDMRCLPLELREDQAKEQHQPNDADHIRPVRNRRISQT